MVGFMVLCRYQIMHSLGVGRHVINSLPSQSTGGFWAMDGQKLGAEQFFLRKMPLQAANGIAYRPNFS